MDLQPQQPQQQINGTRVHEFAWRLGRMKLEVLSEQSGVPLSLLETIDSHESTLVDPEVVTSLARVLQVKPEDLTVPPEENNMMRSDKFVSEEGDIEWLSDEQIRRYIGQE